MYYQKMQENQLFNDNLKNYNECDKKLNDNDKDVKNIVNHMSEWVEINTKILNNEQYKQNIDLRKEYANKIYHFIICWSIFVAVILICQGYDYERDKLYWDKSIIIVLISTTFIQIIGLMLAILKYIFPVNK